MNMDDKTREALEVNLFQGVDEDRKWREASGGEPDTLFACSCGEGGKKQMAELWDWYQNFAYHKDHPLDPRWRLTALSSDLAAIFGAHYEVFTDPGGWSGFVIKTAGYSAAKGKTISGQMDIVEDGILLGFKSLVEEFGVETEDDDEDGEQV